MGIERSRADEELASLREERRSVRGNFLGVATLACPLCDAPAPLLTSPAAPDTELACPYCEHAGAVREFLTFATPPRAARVNVFVSLRQAARAEIGP
jgi:hypothetical protein